MQDLIHDPAGVNRRFAVGGVQEVLLKQRSFHVLYMGHLNVFWMLDNLFDLFFMAIQHDWIFLKNRK